jgi:hypothetical protein
MLLDKLADTDLSQVDYNLDFLCLSLRFESQFGN